MIVINELSTSYITEMEAHEVDSIFGGFFFTPPSIPGIDLNSVVAITPIGGFSVADALDTANGYGPFVVPGLLGGFNTFYAAKPLFS